MRRARAFWSIASTVAIVGGLVLACEDKTPASNFGEGDSGANFDSGRFNTDGTPVTGDGGAINCKPSLPSTFDPQWLPPKKQPSACTADQLAGFYDNCAGDLKSTACLAWISNNKTCDACVEPADGSGPIQPHRERLFQTLNVAGCASIVLNGNDTCPKAYDALFQCRRLSCEDCLGLKGATFTDFTSCEDKTTDTCMKWDTAQASACGSLKSPDAGAPQCFPATGEDVRSHFLRVEAIFCGP